MLVTLWTTKGEQIDLNLREDVTIGELKRTLISEFAYQNNVQLMYSSRICQDDSAVDDYPPGTLMVLGTRQAHQQQPPIGAGNAYGGMNQSPVYGTGLGGYPTHQSSGGTTLRTGHAGGMRAATERKYANDYNEMASQNKPQAQPQNGGGYAQQYQQQRQQPQQTPANNQFQQNYQPQQQAPQQYQQQPARPQYQQQAPQQAQYQQPAPQQQQQQYYAQQPQAQQPAPANNNYANYVNSAASRGMQMPQQQGSGWGGNAGHMDGFTSPTSVPTNYPASPGSSAYGAKPSTAYSQPPNVYGSNAAASPQKSPASEPLGTQPPVASPSANNRATAATPARQEQQQRTAFSPSSQTASQSQEEPAAYFPPVTLTATIVGQGEEKELTVEIDGAATVGELVALLAERAPEVGASIRPSQDSVKLTFFGKYLRNWNDPIRKVPLSSGSNVVVCTGQYVNEQLMTLHSAERAMAQVTREAKAAKAAGDLSAGRKNFLSELLMKSIFDLDGLQDVEEDVRARRKALVKEVTKLQDDLVEGRI